MLFTRLAGRPGDGLPSAYADVPEAERCQPRRALSLAPVQCGANTKHGHRPFAFVGLKATRRARDDGSELDGRTGRALMTFQRRGRRKVIIVPGGSDAWAPTKARPDETLIRALARAHRWNRMLEAGKCRSIAEIAESEKIDRSFVSRLLRLTLLAPGI